MVMQGLIFNIYLPTVYTNKPAECIMSGQSKMQWPDIMHSAGLIVQFFNQMC